eukprot:scaffold596_cov87-Cylindrotheca_fusiformis.AAC.1
MVVLDQKQQKKDNVQQLRAVCIGLNSFLMEMRLRDILLGTAPLRKRALPRLLTEIFGGV